MNVIKVDPIQEYNELLNKHEDMKKLSLASHNLDNASTSFKELLEREEMGYVHLTPELKETVEYAMGEIEQAWARVVKAKDILKKQYTEKESNDGQHVD